jgi:hypothetical protein
MIIEYDYRMRLVKLRKYLNTIMNSNLNKSEPT